MVHHIRNAHSLYIGVEPYNDLIVEYDGELVLVKFSESMNEQTDRQIHEVFNLPETGQKMEKKDYLVFLMKLHAYLTLNPVKRKIGVYFQGGHQIPPIPIAGIGIATEHKPEIF